MKKKIKKIYNIFFDKDKIHELFLQNGNFLLRNIK